MDCEGHFRYLLGCAAISCVSNVQSSSRSNRSQKLSSTSHWRYSEAKKEDWCSDFSLYTYFRGSSKIAIRLISRWLWEHFLERWAVVHEINVWKVRNIKERYPSLALEVDGKVKLATIVKAAPAEANLLVSGLRVYKEEDMRGSIEKLGNGKKAKELSKLQHDNK